MNPVATCDEQDTIEMRELAGGRDSALDSLMERHGPTLVRYLVRQLQNEEDAADLAQETFVRIYQNRHRFNPRHKFTTWMYTIATNLVRDRFRWRTRHPQVPLNGGSEHEGNDSFRADRLPASDALTPSQSLQQDERAESVRKALSELPEELRTPLILSEYEDKSHAEIGEILNCSPKAVEMRLYRGRAQLRKTLAHLL